MKLYLKRKNGLVDAKADYDAETGKFVVLKGSRVSLTISESKTFRGAKAIISKRNEFVSDGMTIKDVEFKSSSTAANFVTGMSTSGPDAWKNAEGNTLKSILQIKEA